MIRRPRPVAGDDALRIEILDALLDDFPPAHRANEHYDPFERFAHSLTELAQLRVEHRELLIEEAVRRGLPAGHLDQVAREKSDAWRLSLPAATPVSGRIH
jgi:hypothetical protein